MKHRNRLDRLIHRRALRRQLSHAEALLWLALKNRQLDGRRFRRQFSVGPFILDFFCPAESLAIELDGASHDHETAQAYDEARDRFLTRHGIRTLRFTNEDVYRRRDAVLAMISTAYSSPPDAQRSDGWHARSA